MCLVCVCCKNFSFFSLHLQVCLFPLFTVVFPWIGVLLGHPQLTVLVAGGGGGGGDFAAGGGGGGGVTTKKLDLGGRDAFGAGTR